MSFSYPRFHHQEEEEEEEGVTLRKRNLEENPKSSAHSFATNASEDRKRCEEQALMLKEQARKYNDLRIAYQSLSRRLEKGGGGRSGRHGGGGGLTPGGDTKKSTNGLTKACHNLRHLPPRSDIRGQSAGMAPGVRGTDVPETNEGRRACCGCGIPIRGL